MSKSVHFKARPQTALALSKAESKDLSLNDSQQLTKLLIKNNNYFNHILDQCVCGLCICGRCKCKTNQLSQQSGLPSQTTYNRDYPQKSVSQSKQIGQLPSYKDNFQMKFESTQRTDYKPIKQRPQTAMKPENPQFLQVFHAASTYQLTHINMPNTEKVDIIPQNFPTVMKDLEFTGNSEYRRIYNGSQLPKADKPLIFGAHSSFGNPINPNLPFFGTTTSSRAFRPFKGKKLAATDKQSHSSSVPTFFGQFTTTTKQDYPDKGLSICPARKILNERKS